ncbi:MCP four helix bundle domain-containing protein [Catenovulum sp. SM1970]|uniref:CHASE3 domain-containing protein n=1 Tax=Marinifaba aquimaris TaxID=2741323 RepID=UPI001573B82A|nr:MCP four helix bundle domain-containing protein [Marinifaba aquimaris]NTS78890.1 MCP four helix bundle domain-containing protein [Marinifaba aquimaris]
MLNSLTPKQKLNSGFGLIVLLMLVVNIISYYLLSRDSELGDEIASDDVPGTIYYMALIDESGDMQSNVLEYLIGESDEIESFEANYEEFKQAFATLKPLESATASDREKMKTIENLGKPIPKQ